MGYFSAGYYATFTQCGRGVASWEYPLAYTNDSSVTDSILSVTVPMGTGADGSLFFTDTSRWHSGNGQPMTLYLQAKGINSNSVNVSNSTPSGSNGRPINSYLVNYTFNFSGLSVSPGETIQFTIPNLDVYSTAYIFCINSYAATGNIVKQQHTVSYNANGGTGAPSSQTKVYGYVLTLSTQIPTRAGYEFLYWNTASNGTGKTYNPGDKYGDDVDVTLYAIWRQKLRYTVTFNANGGTGAPGSQSKLEGDVLTLTTARPSKSYTVTFNPNGGSVSPTTKTVSCRFVRWNTRADGTGTSYASGSQYTADSNVTLYAIWENVAIGTLPTPSRSSCQFHMWTTTLNGSNQVTSSYIVTQNITIYAKWKYAVVFNANGGILTITNGTTVTQQTTATLYKTHGVALTIPTNYVCYIILFQIHIHSHIIFRLRSK